MGKILNFHKKDGDLGRPLTQEEIDELLISLVTVLNGDINKNIVDPSAKKNKSYKSRDIYENVPGVETISSYLEKKNKKLNTPIPLTYCVEYVSIETCPTCGGTFDIEDIYFEDKRCPFCAQLFDIDLWFT